jgi:hypothetical protein
MYRKDIGPNSHYDAVANMRLVVQPKKGTPNEIPLGDNLKESVSRARIVRNAVLDSVAQNIRNPRQVLEQLEEFARGHLRAVAYGEFVEKTFQALSKSAENQ